MNAFRVVPLISDVVQKFRASRRDDFGNAAVVKTADHPNAYPCRHCQRDVEQGTNLLLVAYSPFEGRGPYSEVGPIFVCDKECTRHEGINELPPIARSREIGLRVYNRDNMMNYAHSGLLNRDDADATIRKILDDPDVEKIHVRTAHYGCFLCEIVRA